MFQNSGNLPGRADVVISQSFAAPLVAIGQIQSASGSVIVTRSTGDVALKAGDFVYRGDVIETAAGRAVGIIFADGTAFNLSDSARIAVDEFDCDSKGCLNSALFNLARGAFAYIAGRQTNPDALRIASPFAVVRSAARGYGTGMLTLSAFTFAAIKDLEAGPWIDQNGEP